MYIRKCRANANRGHLETDMEYLFKVQQKPDDLRQQILVWKKLNLNIQLALLLQTAALCGFCSRRCEIMLIYLLL